MSRATIDPNLFTQIGLDSGALTMLGAVVHQFDEPGEYRGTVRRDNDIESVFYISVDKDSPVAQADIDLAALTGSASTANEPNCKDRDAENCFSVNPKGYALFRVTGGSGGFAVHVRRANEDENTRVFDSRRLSDGTIFSATILRPGTYSVTNALGKTRANVVVSYPPKAMSSYRPPEPQRVEVRDDGFYPADIKLKPAQGLIFECQVPSRIMIELVEADDGPEQPRKPGSRGRSRRGAGEGDGKP